MADCYQLALLYGKQAHRLRALAGFGAGLRCGLVVGSLATPIGSLWGSVTEPGRPPRANVTPQLYEALRWIADETSTDSVLAVNNHWFNRQRLAPVAFDYSAFSERRGVLEGWAYAAARSRRVTRRSERAGSIPSSIDSD